MSPFAVVGWAAVALVAVGWLVVSFSPPGPRRATAEWLSATALYVALVSLFAGLVGRAWREDSTAALVGFGFLCLLFGCGALVSLAQTLLSLRGPSRGSPPESSATS